MKIKIWSLISFCILFFASCHKQNDETDATGVWEFTYAEKQGVDITNIYTINPGYLLQISNTSSLAKSMRLIPKNNEKAILFPIFSPSAPADYHVKDKTRLLVNVYFGIDGGFLNTPPEYLLISTCGRVMKLDAKNLHFTFTRNDTIYKFELNKIMDGGKNFYLGN